jgi:hypothetical protein
VQQILQGAGGIPQMAAFEFCYLQLRKICEVFALACLAAHGDIPGVRTKLVQKTYNADQIIKQLTSLHPQFYPTPGHQQLDPISHRPTRVTPVESGFLTKQDLLELYGECGNYLHRGSIRQLLTQWEPKLNFQRIESWMSKIVTLLNHHQIQTSHSDKQLWVLMQSKDDAKVHWSVMQKLSPDDPRICSTPQGGPTSLSDESDPL